MMDDLNFLELCESWSITPGNWREGEGRPILNLAACAACAGKVGPHVSALDLVACGAGAMCDICGAGLRDAACVIRIMGYIGV